MRVECSGPSSGAAAPVMAVNRSWFGVVAAASMALALSAPGQTTVMSVFVDGIIAELGVSRSAVSAAYMAGSLTGAVLMPFIGRAVDRYGPRVVMLGVAGCFGAVLIAASAVSEIFGLTAAFVGVRVCGQGALTLVATTTVAVYLSHRRGLGVGLVSAIGTAAICTAPVLAEPLAAMWGWRQVWIAEGLAVWMVVIPAAWLLLPRPAHPPSPIADDEVHRLLVAADVAGDFSLRQALRTPLFWVVTAAVSSCSMISTGLMFHQQSVLGERGLSTSQSAALFIVQAVAGLVATFVLGWWADRIGDRTLVAVILLALAAATLWAGWLAPGWGAVCYGVMIGVAGNGLRTVEAVAFARSFGVRHLGSIRSVVHSVSVGASAFGPLVVAMGRQHATSYRPVLIVLTVLPLLIAAAALLVKHPRSTAVDEPEATSAPGG
ncbi:MFS transporter [Mycolicibacterium sp.]|uniref:MFS transporter n=1 Tax=Mycolicibacterium sp. TaxID=2320850 RepID=UPI0037C5D68A